MFVQKVMKDAVIKSRVLEVGIPNGATKSQIEQMNNVTITDEMVNEELQRINDLDLGYDGFEIQERHGIKYYCAIS